MDRREALKRTAWIMGGAVSAPAIMGILKGCKAEPTLDWKPTFLSEEQGLLVSQVSDIIIPKTETPGAKEVGVPRFIDEMLREVYTKEDQDTFINALKEFSDEAVKQQGDPFVELDAAKQLEFVTAQHDAAVKAAKETKPAPPRPFVLMMKELTMLGFFTSKAGATEVLQYEPVPGAYKGCLPLSEAGNGKTWAT
jgi:gluconate 2-dehydrogenase gamma chain